MILSSIEKMLDDRETIYLQILKDAWYFRNPSVKWWKNTSQGLKNLGNFTGCGLQKQFLQQEWFFKTHIVIEAGFGRLRGGTHTPPKFHSESLGKLLSFWDGKCSWANC